MGKYLDLLGLTTYDLAIKLYIDNSTPESITTAEIEELFSEGDLPVIKDSWNYPAGYFILMGTYDGIINPLLYCQPGDASTDATFELYCSEQEGGIFVLSNNDEIVVGPSRPSGDTIYEEMKAELDSRYEFASGKGMNSLGWSELNQPPTNYTIIP